MDDNVGVVGEVLRSGEPKIWNSGSDDESRVNRKVDASLEFETRSLVAVPMEGQRDNLIGVFEAINHHGDGFAAFDAAVLADLATHAAVAIESQRTRRQLTETRDRLVDDAASAAPLIGEHPSIEGVRRSAAKVAKTDLTVLVLGKNGTGKEVLARHIHYRKHSPQWSIHRRQLRRSSRNAVGKRTVWARKRRVHRRQPNPHRKVRTCQWRHAVSGRSG